MARQTQGYRIAVISFDSPPFAMLPEVTVCRLNPLCRATSAARQLTDCGKSGRVGHSKNPQNGNVTKPTVNTVNKPIRNQYQQNLMNFIMLSPEP